MKPDAIPFITAPPDTDTPCEAMVFDFLGGTVENGGLRPCAMRGLRYGLCHVHERLALKDIEYAFAASGTNQYELAERLLAHPARWGRRGGGARWLARCPSLALPQRTRCGRNMPRPTGHDNLPARQAVGG